MAKEAGGNQANAGESRAGRGAAMVADPTRAQVLAIVPELPFEDDPAAYARLLSSLADAHALGDEE